MSNEENTALIQLEKQYIILLNALAEIHAIDPLSKESEIARKALQEAVDVTHTN
jgi:hypothetical protein